MNKVLIASRNAGKIEEYRELLSDLPLIILSLADNNFSHLPDVEEIGQTFRENALIKARAAAGAAGLMTLADDSGLEVDYLQGAPGIYSSRYAGSGNDDQANNDKLLEALKGVPLRQRGGQIGRAHV